MVAIQSMFLRPAYQTVARDPKLNETEYQFSNWYHFRWLSGDDVTQSLVHNLDRMRWVLHEENPTTCFGLAGRSTSVLGGAHYTASKHGVIGLTKNTAHMYADKNIRCNAICPGSIKKEVKTVLINAHGFGGRLTTLIVKQFLSERVLS